MKPIPIFLYIISFACLSKSATIGEDNLVQVPSVVMPVRNYEDPKPKEIVAVVVEPCPCAKGSTLDEKVQPIVPQVDEIEPIPNKGGVFSLLNVKGNCPEGFLADKLGNCRELYW
ncbi:uncharacterized protein LOC126881211 [Diabrotica virgifera virgifera]|uniref:Uncharacterized protein LOC114339880 n=1 Tax=Diabrotica virgifera virgifera TaxID=50390 RepID=A0A6P7GAN2_DIAVI|nr:uncharacterized protein LOC126881211 [Diabrotica virgifera virgifera]